MDCNKNNILVIDLSLNGNLPIEFLPLFNEIADEIKIPFHRLIEKISLKNKNNLDWFFSTPASRNPFLSHLYYYCCSIVFIKRIISTNRKIDKIVTDSKAQKIIIDAILSKEGISIPVVCNKYSVTFLKQKLYFVGLLYRFCVYLLYYSWIYMVARYTRKGRISIHDKPLTIIDTFITPGSVDNNRYYPGLLDRLDEVDVDSIFFVPTFTGFMPWKIKKIFNKIRSKNREYILKEDFLKINDYIFALCHIFRILKIDTSETLFLNYDLSEIFKNDLFNIYKSSVEAFLNFRFAMRLNEQSIPIRVVIDWYENQSIDKGWNAGFKTYYPDSILIGYQGYIPLNYEWNIYPTQIEKKENLLPDKIAVIGKDLIENVKLFCEELVICTAPALRYKHIFNANFENRNNQYNAILVALPLYDNEAADILDVLVKSINSIEKDIVFYIKPHPSNYKPLKHFYIDPTLKDRIKIKFSDIDKLIEVSDMLISSASSVCMETIARGVPVIIIGNKRGFTYNPIPKNLKTQMYKICYDKKQLVQSIKVFYDSVINNQQYDKNLNSKIVENYFEAITKRSIKEFLQC